MVKFQKTCGGVDMAKQDKNGKHIQQENSNFNTEHMQENNG